MSLQESGLDFHTPPRNKRAVVETVAGQVSLKISLGFCATENMYLRFMPRTGEKAWEIHGTELIKPTKIHVIARQGPTRLFSLVASSS